MADVRKLLAAFVAALLVFAFTGDAFARGSSSGRSSSSSGGSHTVRGYTKKDGTVVAPHRQTNPNSTQRDNWSSKPNVNPDTGKPGTKTPTR